MNRRGRRVCYDLRRYVTDCSSDKTSSDKTTSDVSKKQQKIDTTGLSQMKKSADGLKETTDAPAGEYLGKQTTGEYDKDKIAEVVIASVSKYNDTLAQILKVNLKIIA